MNDELLKRLEPYKAMLITAARTNCIHGLANKVTAELFDIAEKLNVKHGNVNCPKCVLQTCIALGKILKAEDEKAKLIQEAPKPEDNKTIKETKTVKEKSPKQPQKANKKKTNKK